MQRLSLCIILLTSILSHSAQYPGGEHKQPTPWRQGVVYVQGQRIHPVEVIIRPTIPPIIKMD